MQKEIWKDVVGSAKVYIVSNRGVLESLDHRVVMKDGRVRTQYGRVIKFSISYKGYYDVNVKINGKWLHTGIHRLVAIAFIPNPENKPQVNHLDGDKSNNNDWNLEWATNKENHDHARRNNLMRSNTCEEHHMSKLSNDDVRLCRNLHAKGETSSSLSRRFGVSTAAMSKIVRFMTYKEVE